VWTLTLLAEMAERRGDSTSAETRYKRALAMLPRDSYLLGAFSDFLLEQRGHAEVLAMLKDQTRIDGCCCAARWRCSRCLIQRNALARAGAELQARFGAATQRGDTVHRREQARYELHVQRDHKTALALAQQNWAVQKESADMRILLEAAAKAGDKAAAASVLDWVARTKVEDVAVQRLAQQLKART
jgi:Tfp pilus assembly protein PilF